MVDYTFPYFFQLRKYSLIFDQYQIYDNMTVEIKLDSIPNK